MLKNLFILIAILAAVSSCNFPFKTQVKTETEGTITVSVPARNTVASTAADELGVVAYTVAIFQLSPSFNDSQVIAPGETATFTKLQAGTYGVQVTAVDSDGTTVLAGGDEVTVVAGQTATANVTLNHTTGNITVDITLPEPIL